MISTYSCKYKFFATFLTFTIFFSSISHSKNLKNIYIDKNLNNNTKSARVPSEFMDMLATAMSENSQARITAKNLINKYLTSLSEDSIIKNNVLILLKLLEINVLTTDALLAFTSYMQEVGPKIGVNLVIQENDPSLEIALESSIAEISPDGDLTLAITKTRGLEIFEELLIRQNQHKLIEIMYIYELEKSIIKLLIKNKTNPRVLRLILNALKRKPLCNILDLEVINNYLNKILAHSLTLENIDTVLRNRDEFYNAIFIAIQNFNRHNMLGSYDDNLASLLADILENLPQEEEEEEEGVENDQEDLLEEYGAPTPTASSSGSSSESNSLIDFENYDEDRYENSDIFEAIKRGDFDRLKFLVEVMHVNLDIIHKSGIHLVFYAAKKPNKEILKYVLRHYPDIISLFSDLDPTTPLEYIVTNKRDIVKKSMPFTEASLQYRPHRMITILSDFLVLHYIQLNLKNGAITKENVNDSISNSFIPAYLSDFAIAYNDFNTLNTLLRLGADPTRIVIKLLEADTVNLDLIDKLVRKGVNPDEVAKKLLEVALRDPSENLHLLIYGINTFILSGIVDPNIVVDWLPKTYLESCIKANYQLGFFQILHILIEQNKPLVLDEGFGHLTYQRKLAVLRNEHLYEAGLLLRLKVMLEETSKLLTAEDFSNAVKKAEAAKKIIVELFNTRIPIATLRYYNLESHIMLLETLQIFLLKFNEVLSIAYQHTPNSYTKSLVLYREPTFPIRPSELYSQTAETELEDTLSSSNLASRWRWVEKFIPDFIKIFIYRSELLKIVFSRQTQQNMFDTLRHKYDPETNRPYFADLEVVTVDNTQLLKDIEETRNLALDTFNLEEALKLLNIIMRKAQFNELAFLVNQIETDIASIYRKELEIEEAIKNGTLDIQANLDYRDTSGNSILHLAIDLNPGLVDSILEENSSRQDDSTLINLRNNDGFTPFLLAAAKNELGILKILKEQGADINLQNKDKNNALHLAVQNNNLEVAEYLLSIGINLLAKNKDEHTPHSLAVSLYTLQGNISQAISTVINRIFEMIKNRDLEGIKQYINRENGNIHLINALGSSIFHELIFNVMQNKFAMTLGINSMSDLSVLNDTPEEEEEEEEEEQQPSISPEEKHLDYLKILKYFMQDCGFIDSVNYSENTQTKTYFYIKDGLKIDIKTIPPESYDILQMIKNIIPNELFHKLLKEYLLIEHLKISAHLNSDDIERLSSSAFNDFKYLFDVVSYIRTVNSINSPEDIKVINWHLNTLKNIKIGNLKINLSINEVLNQLGLSNLKSLLRSEVAVVSRDEDNNVLIGLNQFLVLKIDQNGLIQIEDQSIDEQSFIAQTALESLNDRRLSTLDNSITDPLKLGQFIGSMLNRILKLPLLQSGKLRQSPIELRNTIDCIINSV